MRSGPSKRVPFFLAVVFVALLPPSIVMAETLTTRPAQLFGFPEVALGVSLDSDGPNTWSLIIQDFSLSNYGHVTHRGIASFSIPLLNVTSVQNVTPWIFADESNFQPAGFSEVRSGPNNSVVTGSQKLVPTPTPNIIYGFGQVDSSFAEEGYSVLPTLGPDEYAQLDWGVPLLLATGTYGSVAPEVDYSSVELYVVVFDIPEPASIVMAALGALGLMGFTRRR